MLSDAELSLGIGIGNFIFVIGIRIHINSRVNLLFVVPVVLRGNGFNPVGLGNKKGHIVLRLFIWLCPWLDSIDGVLC